MRRPLSLHDFRARLLFPLTKRSSHMRNNSVRIISVMLSDTQSNNLSLSAVKQALLLDMTHYIVTITAAVLLLLVGKNPPFDRYWSPERRVRKIKVWSSKYNQNLFSFLYLWLRTGEISFRLKKLSNFLDLFFPSVRQMENKSLIRWERKKKFHHDHFSHLWENEWRNAEHLSCWTMATMWTRLGSDVCLSGLP